MLLDWWTVIAQIVNFLLLIGLLKYFLYGRIINAMDQRERKIASRWEEAEKKKQAAGREAEAYRRNRLEIEEKRAELLDRARSEAQDRRKELLKKARQDVDEIKAKWYDRVRREKNSFLQNLRSRAGSQVYAVARRALSDLAGSDLQQRMTEVFIQRIAELDEERKTAIAESIQKENHGISVNSAFEIPEEERQKITEAVRDNIRADADVSFTTLPDMILGIELKTYGHKVAWSLDDYLDSLEANISRAIEEAGGESPGAPRPT